MKLNVKKSILKPFALALLVLPLIASAPLSAAEPFEKYTLSIPDLKIGENERVDSFTVVISYGDVISLPHIPTGWSVHIDNSPLWKTTVRWNISVGAAALTHRQTDFFKDFLVIQRNDREFPVHIEITITTYSMESSPKQSKRVIGNDGIKLTAIDE